MYRNFTVKTVKCQSQKMDKGPFLEQDPNQDWKYGESRLVLSLHPNCGIFFLHMVLCTFPRLLIRRLL